MTMKHKLKNLLMLTALITAIAFGGAVTVLAQTTQFTYQGRFTDSTLPSPTNGTYQMEFALFDSVSGGNQSGSTITLPAVQLVNGIFTVQLDYDSTPFRTQ